MKENQRFINKQRQRRDPSNDKFAVPPKNTPISEAKNPKEIKISQNYFINQVNITNLKNKFMENSKTKKMLKKMLEEQPFPQPNTLEKMESYPKHLGLSEFVVGSEIAVGVVTEEGIHESHNAKGSGLFAKNIQLKPPLDEEGHGKSFIQSMKAPTNLSFKKKSSEKKFNLFKNTKHSKSEILEKIPKMKKEAKSHEHQDYQEPEEEKEFRQEERSGFDRRKLSLDPTKTTQKLKDLGPQLSNDKIKRNKSSHDQKRFQAERSHGRSPNLTSQGKKKKRRSDISSSKLRKHYSSYMMEAARGGSGLLGGHKGASGGTSVGKSAKSKHKRHYSDYNQNASRSGKKTPIKQNRGGAGKQSDQLSHLNSSQKKQEQMRQRRKNMNYLDVRRKKRNLRHSRIKSAGIKKGTGKKGYRSGNGSSYITSFKDQKHASLQAAKRADKENFSFKPNNQPNYSLSAIVSKKDIRPLALDVGERSGRFQNLGSDRSRNPIKAGGRDETSTSFILAAVSADGVIDSKNRISGRPEPEPTTNDQFETSPAYRKDEIPRIEFDGIIKMGSSSKKKKNYLKSPDRQKKPINPKNFYFKNSKNCNTSHLRKSSKNLHKRRRSDQNTLNFAKNSKKSNSKKKRSIMSSMSSSHLLGSLTVNKSSKKQPRNSQKQPKYAFGSKKYSLQNDWSKSHISSSGGHSSQPSSNKASQPAPPNKSKPQKRSSLDYTKQIRMMSYGEFGIGKERVEYNKGSFLNKHYKFKRKHIFQRKSFDVKKTNKRAPGAPKDKAMKAQGLHHSETAPKGALLSNKSKYGQKKKNLKKDKSEQGSAAKGKDLSCMWKKRPRTSLSQSYLDRQRSRSKNTKDKEVKRKLDFSGKGGFSQNYLNKGRGRKGGSSSSKALRKKEVLGAKLIRGRKENGEKSERTNQFLTGSEATEITKQKNYSKIQDHHDNELTANNTKNNDKTNNNEHPGGLLESSPEFKFTNSSQENNLLLSSENTNQEQELTEINMNNNISSQNSTNNLNNDTTSLFVHPTTSNSNQRSKKIKKLQIRDKNEQESFTTEHGGLTNEFDPDGQVMPTEFNEGAQNGPEAVQEDHQRPENPSQFEGNGYGDGPPEIEQDDYMEFCDGYEQSEDRLRVYKNCLESFTMRTRRGKTNNVDKTNQDSFIAQPNFRGLNDNHLFGVYDGHGLNGHLVSNYISSQLPILLNELQRLQEQQALQHQRYPVEQPTQETQEQTHPTSEENPAKNTPQQQQPTPYDGIPSLNLVETLEEVYKQLFEALVNGNIDVSYSGSTALTCLIHNNYIYTANCGDSRAMLGLKNPELGWYYSPLSRDHKPDLKDELTRIIHCGGRVEPYIVDGEGVGPYRVWLQEENAPGLAMSRSLGDLVAASVGVAWMPEIFKHEISFEEQFLIIASDGVWEFLSNQDVLDIISEYKDRSDIEGACDQLMRESLRNWGEEEADCVDDITFVLVFFEPRVIN